MFRSQRDEVQSDAAPPAPRSSAEAVQSACSDSLTNTEWIIVLGGGITGLTAAWELSKRSGSPVLLIEKSAASGGLAGSFSRQDYTFDLGSHRIHEQYDPEVLGIIKSLLGEDLLVRPRRGKIRIQNRLLDYPPSLLQVLTSFGLAAGSRIAGGYLLSRSHLNFLFARRKGGHAEDSFESYAIRGVGRSLYEKFYKPYALKLWGVQPGSLSFEPAMSRIKKFELRAVWHEVKRKIVRGGAVHSYYYPAKGFGQVAAKLQEKFLESGGTISFDSVIERLELERDCKIKAVQVRLPDGSLRRLPTRLLISTAPIDVLHDLVRFQRDNEAVPKLNLSWRSLRILYLLTPDKIPARHETYYFPESDVIFSRVSEPAKYSPALQPQNGTSALAIELPCTYGDPLWQMPDDRLAEHCINDLRKVKILSARPGGKTEFFSRRIKNLYPIYALGWREHFQEAMRRFEAIENLYLVGRSALFLHCNVDHCMAMALKLARFLSAGQGPKADWERVQSEFHKLPLHD